MNRMTNLKEITIDGTTYALTPIAPQPEPEPKVWKPKLGESCWFLNALGQVAHLSYSDDWLIAYEQGNLAPYTDKGKAYLEAVAWHQRELQKCRSLEWLDRERSWFAYYSRGQNRVVVEGFLNLLPYGVILRKTEAEAVADIPMIETLMEGPA